MSISSMVDQAPASMSQTSRGFQLRIDTSVPSPSLAVPQYQSSRWLSPTTPSTPGLQRSAATSGFSPGLVTPSSPLPGWLNSPTQRKVSDIDVRGEENSIYSREPRERTLWSPLRRRFSSTVRALGQPRSLREADPYLSNLTLNVIGSGLNDWSLVESVCKSASVDPSNASCVLKSIVRSFMTGDGFQQLAAGRMPMKVILSQAAKSEFLMALERIIISSKLEMVAIDRVVSVLATIVQDKRTSAETSSYTRLWGKLPGLKRLCSPLSPDDVLYHPGSLVRSSSGSVVPDHTVATPLPYGAALPTTSDQPIHLTLTAPTPEEPMSPSSFVASPKSMSGTANAWPRPTSPPQITVEVSTEMLPPPYSASRFSSEPGPSVQRSTSVIDSYPFAKGYASDVGPDINLDTLEAYPFAKGAFGDVRRATLHNGMRVAIKCLRFYTSALDTGRHRLEKRSLKEIQVWSYLNHENVLPLIGLCVVNNELGMVSELMPNGNVQEYIQRNPSVDRYRLAIHVCAGLVYLHEHPKHVVVHGDLKAVNVVVNADGIPKLTDFGLAQMVRAEDSTERSSSSNVGGTARWMAYEQICPIAPETVCQKPNASSDVYSLGMTFYEIFSGKLPFAELRNDAQVIHAIMHGKLPERTPNAFSDPVWELLNQCWQRNPNDRPTARCVLNALQQISLSTN